MKRIFVDFDNTLVQTSKRLIEMVKASTGEVLHPVNIRDWHMMSSDQFVPYYHKPEFYQGVSFYPHAKKTLHNLVDSGWDVFIVTGYVKSPSLQNKADCIARSMPWFDIDNYFVALNQKWILEDGILIEDRPDTLDHFKGTKICFEQPYNVSVRGRVDLSTDNWEVIGAFLS